MYDHAEHLREYSARNLSMKIGQRFGCPGDFFIHKYIKGPGDKYTSLALCGIEVCGISEPERYMECPECFNLAIEMCRSHYARSLQPPTWSIGGPFLKE